MRSAFLVTLNQPTVKTLIYLILFIPSLCIANSSAFVKNKGQVKDTEGNFRDDVLFKYEQEGLSVFFFSDKVSYVLHQGSQEDSTMLYLHRVDWNWKHCNPITPVFKGRVTKVHTNYYLNTREILGIETGQSIIYENLYNGVSLVFYIKEGRLKYDYLVASQNALGQIRSHYVGGDFQLAANGAFEMITSLGTLSDSKPESFDATGEPIESGFIYDQEELSYTVSEAAQYPITIDPEIQWSTFFGGFQFETGYAIEHDDSNNVYVGGLTSSIDFPTTTGAYSTTNQGFNDCVLSKFSPSGQLVWSTYIGGTSSDYILDMSIDLKGTVHCALLTSSSSFPVTSNARKSTYTDFGAYSRFSRNGRLLYSSFLPLDGAAIATDTTGRVYISGPTTNTFPLKGNSYQTIRQGRADFGLLVFDDKDTLVWSTLFGGGSREGSVANVKVNPKGDKIALIGFTQSDDFPMKKAYVSKVDSVTFNSNLVLACFDSTGDLKFSTYLSPPTGASGFGSNALEFIGNTKLVVGSENAQITFPTKPNTWKAKPSVQGAFIAIFDTAGTAQRVSFDSPQSQSFGKIITSVDVDSDLNLHVVCEVSNDSIRPTADALKKVGSRFFIGINQGELAYMVMDTSLNIKYATYLGGNKSFESFPKISVNSFNEASIVCGTANTSDFPVKNAYQNRLNGGGDMAVLQFSCNYEPKTNLLGGKTICKGDSVVLVVDSGLAKYQWSPVNSKTNVLKATAPGKYYVIVTDSNGCSGGVQDSFVLENFKPLDPTIQALTATQFCAGDSARLRGTVSNFKSLKWSNGDTTLRTTAFKSGNYFLLASDSNGCEDTSNIVRITAIPKPNPTITSSTGSPNLCRKFTDITLDVGTGYSAYKWSTGATTNSIKVTKTGWYKVVVFNGFNCSDSDSVFVRNSVASPPIISNVNPVKFCKGDSVSFSAPSGYSNFLWSTGSRNPSIKVGRNRTVFLIASDTNGCRDTSNIVSTQRIVDSLRIKSSGLGPFCYNEVLNLEVDTGYSAYRWSTNDSTRSISLQGSGSYYVSAVSSSGCKVQSDTFNATFFNKTTATILYNNPLQFCAGDSVRLFFTGAFNSFSWSTGNFRNQSIYAKQSGVYTLNIVDTNNCKAESDSVTVKVDPLPIAQVTSNAGFSFCDRDSILIGTNRSFRTYKWSNGSSKSSFYVSEGARLWATVTDNNGCSNNSDTVQITKFDLPDTSSSTLGSSTFCQGDSFVIRLNDSTSTIRWNDNSTSRQRAIKTSGTYRAVLQNTFGCVDSTKDFNVVVNANPKPRLSANGPLAFCENFSPRRLSTVSSYSSYAWNTTETSAQIDVDSSGAYYLRATDAKGCSGFSDTLNITVYDLPKPEIVGFNGNSFCDGDSSFITTTRPYAKYLWSNASTQSGFMVKSATSLFVEVTDSNGCVNRSSTARISILPLPAPFSISSVGSASVCYPNTVTLSGPVNQSKYTWSNGSKNNQITLDSTQKLSLTVENIFGCQRKSRDSFQVYVGRPAPLQLDGDESFCLGDSFYIEAAPGFSSYQWSNGSSGRSISIKTTDTFYLTTVDSIGCTFNSDTFYTNARPLQVPKPWSIARGSTEFCDGDSLELLSPAGYVAYAWNNGATTSSTFAKQSGSYEVLVFDSLGCRGRSPAIEVTVFQLPEPVIESVQDIYCLGDSVELGVLEPYTTYLWSTNSFDSIVSITQDGVFRVTVQDSNQCFGTSQDFSVAFNEKPSFVIDTLVFTGSCNGDSMNLAVVTRNESSTVLWTDGTATKEKTIESNEVYGFTVTNEAGCTQSLSEVQFATFENPVPTIALNGNDSICVGDSVSLSLSRPYREIRWNNETLSRNAITVYATSNNYVLVTDSNGCQGTDSIAIKAIDLPNAQLNYSNSVAICPFDSVELTPDASFSSYQWNTGSTASSIWVRDNGVFWLEVSNDFGCFNTSDTVNVTVKQIPDSIRLTHKEGVLSANTDSLDTYNWYKYEGTDAYALTGEGSKKLWVKESTFYFLTAESRGCELISDTLYIEYYDSSKTLDFALYPNPTLGNVFLNIDAVNPNTLWCFVIDAQGRTVRQYDLGTGDRMAEELNLLQLNRGVYQVMLVNGEEVFTQPFVKIE